MNIYKLLSIIYYVGMIMVLAGVLLQLNGLNYAMYILIAGIIPLLGIRIYNMMFGKPENKRLNSILVVSALFLSLSAACIYFHKSYWIIGVLLTATLDLYVSFRRFKK